jgi:hypothetical protein
MEMMWRTYRLRWERLFSWLQWNSFRLHDLQGLNVIHCLFFLRMTICLCEPTSFKLMRIPGNTCELPAFLPQAAAWFRDYLLWLLSFITKNWFAPIWPVIELLVTWDYRVLDHSYVWLFWMYYKTGGVSKILVLLCYDLLPKNVEMWGFLFLGFFVFDQGEAVWEVFNSVPTVCLQDATIKEWYGVAWVVAFYIG